MTIQEEQRTAPTLDTLRVQRDAILALAAQYGAYNVRVFGSVARGDATPESDIDLLISTVEGVTMFDLVGLWLDLQDLLARDVSLITDDDHPRRARFMKQVRRDVLPL